MVTLKNINNDKLRNIAVKSALRHAVFDGWSHLAFEKVCLELDLSETDLKALFPRGAPDMALAFHERDDKEFLKRFLISKNNNSRYRVRDRIEFAINFRLEIAEKNKEAVRRSIALLTTPIYFLEGSRAVWKTADKIWNSIGDNSYDLNWYSKRFILSSVYSTVLVFWLEDDSVNFSETRDFVTRRIHDVMTVERFKGVIKKSPVGGQLLEQFESFVGDMLAQKESFPGWQRK
jgi:ubiquinone biosynthesis protein COQ9